MDHGIWIGSVWIVTVVVGAIGLPISRFLFSSSSDGGYAYSKILSWFSLGYLTFLTATLGIVPLAFPAIISALLIWAAANAFVHFKLQAQLAPLPRVSQIVITEIIFLAGCAVLVIIKGYHPEIYQIERFMDFGFIETLRNSTSLPLADLWLAGQTLNYYYMSHVIGFIILTLAGIPSVPGFFILIGCIVGTLGATIARFAIDVASYMVAGKEKLSRVAKFSVASISVFTALFSGSWYMIPWIWHRIGFVFGIGQMPNFFYPEPTRAIPGTITEMPIFSFLVADIHAHVWGMLSAVLVLAIAYSLWRDASVKLDAKNRYLWALVGALGMAFMVNSWDAIALGALSVFFIALKYRHESKIHIAVAAVLLAGLSYGIALPWSLTNTLPLQGVGLVHGVSPILSWLSFWGSIATVIIVYMGRVLWMRKKLTEQFDTVLFAGIVFGTSVLFLVLIEIVFMKDILINGEWYRANTVFKVSTQVWIWVSMLAGPVYLWFYRSLTNRLAKVSTVFFLAIYLGIGAAYPVIAIDQAFIGGHTFVGVDHGLDWWKNKYPDDYAAYQYLEGIKNALPLNKRLKTIVEAEGESYTDVSRFSVFLGWPTIVGWPVHEWTWRGNYDIVGKRREEVRNIYTNNDIQLTRDLIRRYNVDYIVLGSVERDRYGAAIQEAKLRSLGKVVFEQGKTVVISLH